MRILFVLCFLSSLTGCDISVGIENEGVGETEVLYVNTFDNFSPDAQRWRFGVVGAAVADSMPAVRLRNFRLPIVGTDYSEGIGEISGAPAARQVAYLTAAFEVGAPPRDARLTVEVDYAVPDSLADASIRLAVAVSDLEPTVSVDRVGRADLSVGDRSVSRGFDGFREVAAAVATRPFATADFTTDFRSDAAGQVYVVVLVEFPAGSEGAIWLRHVRVIAFAE